MERGSPRRPWYLAAWPVVLPLLWACATDRAAVPAPPGYIVLGPSGQRIVRALTPAAQCPALAIDGEPKAMDVRAAPRVVAARKAGGEPAVFEVRVCESALPADARRARLAGSELPLAQGPIRRIVVLGDTGCRIKAAEHAFQACDDPRQWPFAQVAASAAREAPDLVIHVGDYHYRESRCPDDQPCAGSVWGYGWDAWKADFFDPAAPLLRAAPWVFVRGNHEECARAGQGWFRFLDPAPYSAGRNCDDPASDGDADFSAPYAVPIGAQWQLIVFDSAKASQPLDPAREPDGRRLARYREGMRQAAALAAAPGVHSLFVSHHPPLGFTSDGAGLGFGNEVLLAAMKDVNGPRYFPPGVEASLHGHVHTFEAIAFASGHPPALVAGHGGDNLDRVFDGGIAAAYASVPGVRVASVINDSGFGYLVLERTQRGWTVHARRSDGSPLADCELQDAQLACGPGARRLLPSAGSAATRLR